MSNNDERARGAKQRLDGMVDQVKGRARQALGGLSGETDEQLRGKGEELRGKMKSGIGKLRQDLADDDEETTDTTKGTR
ncbi:MAG: hypothetical protein K2R93_11175 [Gemmatimonadaceae bacterium]|nr:hypothetical protein [Gemmatimonadaceae bacterium]